MTTYTQVRTVTDEGWKPIELSKRSRTMNMKELRKNFRDMDSQRVLEMIGLERRRSPARRLVPLFALFGAGILVGVGVGMMVAPRRGRELRDELKEKFEKGIPRAAEAIESAVEQAKARSARPSAPHS